MNVKLELLKLTKTNATVLLCLIIPLCLQISPCECNHVCSQLQCVSASLSHCLQFQYNMIYISSMSTWDPRLVRQQCTKRYYITRSSAIADKLHTLSVTSHPTLYTVFRKNTRWHFVLYLPE